MQDLGLGVRDAPGSRGFSFGRRPLTVARRVDEHSVGISTNRYWFAIGDAQELPWSQASSMSMWAMISAQGTVDRSGLSCCSRALSSAALVRMTSGVTRGVVRVLMGPRDNPGACRLHRRCGTSRVRRPWFSARRRGRRADGSEYRPEAESCFSDLGVCRTKPGVQANAPTIQVGGAGR